MVKKKSKIDKEKVLKVLKLVGQALGFGLLLGAFIGFVVVGTKGCNKQSNKEQENALVRKASNRDVGPFDYEGEYYTYKSKYEGTNVPIDLSLQNQLLTYYFNVNVYDEVWSEVGAQGNHVDISLNGVYGYDTSISDFVSIEKFTIEIVTYSQRGGYEYSWRLFNIYFTSTYVYGYAHKNVNAQNGDGYYDHYYNFDTWDTSPIYNKLYCTNEILQEPFFDIFFTQFTSQSFTFNNQINYNAPYGLTLNNPYVQGGYSTDQIKEYDLWFISGGELFNKIICRYFLSNSMYFDIEGSKKLGASGSVSYMFMEYWNTLTNHVVIANIRDSAEFSPSSSSVGRYQMNSSTWVSTFYQTIHILDNTNEIAINLSKFNNNYNSFNGGFGNNGGNVFDLISQAFGSFTNLFSQQVLPGITIGILVFIPLVATIVFALIKILKK